MAGIMKTSVAATVILLSLTDVSYALVSCNVPPPVPAAGDLRRCSDPADCRIGSNATSGWLPYKELEPVGRVPETILKNAEQSGGPGYVTDESKISSKGIVYGVNPTLGGGYGVYFSVDGGKSNEARFGFGDGWQASIRDQLHAGNWNPTQAGAGWAIGVPASPSRVANGFVIGRYNLPNFINQRYDYLENDSIRDRSGRDYRGRQANGTDIDGCSNETLDDEIRSEFDFTGEVAFATRELQSVIPVLRMRTYFEYTRPPRSVRQFFNSIDERWRTYISPRIYSNSLAQDTDLSLAVYSWGLRLRADTDFVYRGVISEDGGWQFQRLQPQGGERTRDYTNIYRKPVTYIAERMASGKAPALLSQASSTKMPLVVLSDGTDQSASRAIGLFFPYWSDTNKMQTVGVKDKSAVYYEDRMLSASILSVIKQQGRRGDNFVNLTLRVWTSGLLEPRRTIAGVREAFRASVYVLYGSPIEIYKQAKAMRLMNNL